MGVECSRWAWDVPGLGSGERLVLVKLADNANDATRRCWPSVGYVARKCELSERQVKRLIAALVRKGHLFREGRRPGKSVRDDSSWLYVLNVDGPASEVLFEAAAAVPAGDTQGGGDKLTPGHSRHQGVTSTTSGGDISRTPIKEEPPEENHQGTHTHPARADAAPAGAPAEPALPPSVPDARTARAAARTGSSSVKPLLSAPQDLTAEQRARLPGLLEIRGCEIPAGALEAELRDYLDTALTQNWTSTDWPVDFAKYATRQFGRGMLLWQQRQRAFRRDQQAPGGAAHPAARPGLADSARTLRKAE